MNKDGVGGVDGLDDATSVTLSPDARHLYATSWDDNAISVFSRNSTTGALTYVEIKQDGVGGVDGLTGANSVAVSSDGKHVYAAGATDGAISVFSRNSSTGALTFVEVQKDGVNGVGLSDVRAVTLSPNGNQVFAASRGEGEIRVYSRNSSTGALT